MIKKQTDLLDKYLAPAGGITALKFTPQGLLVTFEKEIPEKFSIVTGVMEAMQLINDMLHETATRTRQEDIETINKLAPLASIGFNGETHYLISRAEAINSLNK